MWSVFHIGKSSHGAHLLPALGSDPEILASQYIVPAPIYLEADPESGRGGVSA